VDWCNIHRKSGAHLQFVGEQQSSSSVGLWWKPNGDERHLHHKPAVSGSYDGAFAVGVVKGENMNTSTENGDKVTTTLGELPETDLGIKLVEQEGNANTWVVARECCYKGSDSALAAHLGEIVRRDVWVTIKCGHAMTGEGNL
jgi:hypothetical protein